MYFLASRHVYIKRVIAFVVVCLFFWNSIANALPFENLPTRPLDHTLQAQSLMQKVLVDAGTREDTQLALEMLTILGAVFLHDDWSEIDVDTLVANWYGNMIEKPFGHMYITDISSEITRGKGPIRFTVDIIGGPNKGQQLTIKTSCKSLIDFCDNPDAVFIEIVNTERGRTDVIEPVTAPLPEVDGEVEKQLEAFIAEIGPEYSFGVGKIYSIEDSSGWMWGKQDFEEKFLRFWERVPILFKGMGFLTPICVGDMLRNAKDAVVAVYDPEVFKGELPDYYRGEITISFEIKSSLGEKVLEIKVTDNGVGKLFKDADTRYKAKHGADKKYKSSQERKHAYFGGQGRFIELLDELLPSGSSFVLDSAETFDQESRTTAILTVPLRHLVVKERFDVPQEPETSGQRLTIKAESSDSAIPGNMEDFQVEELRYDTPWNAGESEDDVPIFISTEHVTSYSAVTKAIETGVLTEGEAVVVNFDRHEDRVGDVSLPRSNNWVRILEERGRISDSLWVGGHNPSLPKDNAFNLTNFSDRSRMENKEIVLSFDIDYFDGLSGEEQDQAIDDILRFVGDLELNVKLVTIAYSPSYCHSIDPEEVAYKLCSKLGVQIIPNGTNIARMEYLNYCGICTLPRESATRGQRLETEDASVDMIIQHVEELLLPRLPDEFRTNIDHGLEHSRSLIQNAKELISRLGVEDDVDWKVLATAIYLHDIEYAKDDHGTRAQERVRSIISDSDGFAEAQILKVEAAVLLHDKYKPEDVESRKDGGVEVEILYDVDQIEAFGVKGIYRYIKAYSRRGTPYKEISTNASKRYKNLAFDETRMMIGKNYVLLLAFFERLAEEDYPDDHEACAAGIVRSICAKQNVTPQEIAQDALNVLHSKRKLFLKTFPEEQSTEYEAWQEEAKNYAYAIEFFDRLDSIYTERHDTPEITHKDITDTELEVETAFLTFVQQLVYRLGPDSESQVRRVCAYVLATLYEKNIYDRATMEIKIGEVAYLPFEFLMSAFQDEERYGDVLRIATQLVKTGLVTAEQITHAELLGYISLNLYESSQRLYSDSLELVRFLYDNGLMQKQDFDGYGIPAKVVACMAGIRGPDSAEMAKYLVENDVIKPDDAIFREGIDIKGIIAEIKSFDNHLRSEAALTLKLLDEAGIINKDDIDSAEYINELVWGLQEHDSSVRTDTGEVLMTLSAGGFISYEDVNDILLLQDICHNLEYVSGGISYSAIEALVSLVKAQLLRREDIVDTEILQGLIEGLNIDKFDFTSGCAEVLAELVRQNLFEADEIREKISIKKLMEYVNGRDHIQVRHMASALQHLAGAGIIDKTYLNTNNFDFDELLRWVGFGGIADPTEAALILFKAGLITKIEIEEHVSLSDRWEKKSNAAAVRELCSGTSLMPINERNKKGPAADILLLLSNLEKDRIKDLRRQLNTGSLAKSDFVGVDKTKVFDLFEIEHKKSLPQGFYYFYLRLMKELRDDESAVQRIPTFLTDELLVLSQQEDPEMLELFFKVLGRAIRKGNYTPEQAESRIRAKLAKILAERIVGEGEGKVDSDFLTSNVSSLIPLIRHASQFFRGIIMLGKKIPKTLKEAFRLIEMQFRDGGNSPTTTSTIMEQFARSLPEAHVEKLPIEMPVYKERDVLDARARYRLATEQLQETPIVDVKNVEKLLKGAVLYRTMGRTLVYKKGKKYIALKFLKNTKVTMPNGGIQDITEYPAKLAYENEFFDYLNELKKNGVPLKGNYPKGMRLEDKRVVRVKSAGLSKEIKRELRKFKTKTNRSDTKNTVDNTDGFYTVMAYTSTKADYFTYLHEVDDEKVAKKASSMNMHDLFTLLRYGIIHPDIIELFHNLVQFGRADRGKYLLLVDIIRPMGTRNGSGRLHAWERTVDYPNMRLSGPADFAEMVHIDELVGLDHPHSLYMANSLERFPKEDIKKFILAHFMSSYMLAWILTEGRRRKVMDIKQFKSDDLGGLDTMVKSVLAAAYKAYAGTSGTDLSSLIDWKKAARQMKVFMTELYVKMLREENVPESLFDKGTIFDYAHNLEGSRGWDEKHGWRVDGKNDDIGPVNGALPLQEMVKACYLYSMTMIGRKIVTEASKTEDDISGALKVIGPPLDDSEITNMSELEKKRNCADYAYRDLKPKEYKFKVNTIEGKKKTVKITARIMNADGHLPQTISAWRVTPRKYDKKKGMIVAIRSRYNEDSDLRNEVLYHEWREGVWMKKGLSMREAHILAAAEEVVAFSQLGRLTPYHIVQIDDLTKSALVGLVSEVREMQHSIIRKHLGNSYINRIREYEKLIVGKAADKVEIMEERDPAFPYLPEDLIPHLFGDDDAYEVIVEEQIRLTNNRLAMELLQEGAQLREIGAEDEALVKLQQAFVYDKDLLPALRLITNILISKGEYLAAKPFLKKLVKIDKDDYRAWASLGTAYLIQSRIKEHDYSSDHNAEAAFEKSVKINPQYFEGWMMLAAYNIEKDWTHKFPEQLEKALEIRPKDTDTMLILAKAKMSRFGVSKESEAYIRRILALKPDCDEAWTLKGEILLKKGQKYFVGAERALKRALEINKKNDSAARFLAALEEKRKTVRDKLKNAKVLIGSERIRNAIEKMGIKIEVAEESMNEVTEISIDRQRILIGPDFVKLYEGENPVLTKAEADRVLNAYFRGFYLQLFLNWGEERYSGGREVTAASFLAAARLFAVDPEMARSIISKIPGAKRKSYEMLGVYSKILEADGLDTVFSNGGRGLSDKFVSMFTEGSESARIMLQTDSQHDFIAWKSMEELIWLTDLYLILDNPEEVLAESVPVPREAVDADERTDPWPGRGMSCVETIAEQCKDKLSPEMVTELLKVALYAKGHMRQDANKILSNLFYSMSDKKLGKKLLSDEYERLLYAEIKMRLARAKNEDEAPYDLLDKYKYVVKMRPELITRDKIDLLWKMSCYLEISSREEDADKFRGFPKMRQLLSGFFAKAMIGREDKEKYYSHISGSSTILNDIMVGIVNGRPELITERDVKQMLFFLSVGSDIVRIERDKMLELFNMFCKKVPKYIDKLAVPALFDGIIEYGGKYSDTGEDYWQVNINNVKALRLYVENMESKFPAAKFSELLCHLNTRVHGGDGIKAIGDLLADILKYDKVDLNADHFDIVFSEQEENFAYYRGEIIGKILPKMFEKMKPEFAVEIAVKMFRTMMRKVDIERNVDGAKTVDIYEGIDTEKAGGYFLTIFKKYKKVYNDEMMQEVIGAYRGLLPSRSKNAIKLRANLLWVLINMFEEHSERISPDFAALMLKRVKPVKSKKYESAQEVSRCFKIYESYINSGEAIVSLSDAKKIFRLANELKGDRGVYELKSKDMFEIFKAMIKIYAEYDRAKRTRFMEWMFNGLQPIIIFFDHRNPYYENGVKMFYETLSLLWKKGEPLPEIIQQTYLPVIKMRMKEKEDNHRHYFESMYQEFIVREVVPFTEEENERVLGELFSETSRGGREFFHPYRKLKGFDEAATIKRIEEKIMSVDNKLSAAPYEVYAEYIKKKKVVPTLDDLLMFIELHLKDKREVHVHQRNSRFGVLVSETLNRYPELAKGKDVAEKLRIMSQSGELGPPEGYNSERANNLRFMMELLKNRKVRYRVVTEEYIESLVNFMFDHGVRGAGERQSGSFFGGLAVTQEGGVVMEMLNSLIEKSYDPRWFGPELLDIIKVKLKDKKYTLTGYSVFRQLVEPLAKYAEEDIFSDLLDLLENKKVDSEARRHYLNAIFMDLITLNETALSSKIEERIAKLIRSSSHDISTFAIAAYIAMVKNGQDAFLGSKAQSMLTLFRNNAKRYRAGNFMKLLSVIMAKDPEGVGPENFIALLGLMKEGSDDEGKFSDMLDLFLNNDFEWMDADVFSVAIGLLLKDLGFEVGDFHLRDRFDRWQEEYYRGSRDNRGVSINALGRIIESKHENVPKELMLEVKNGLFSILNDGRNKLGYSTIVSNPPKSSDLNCLISITLRRLPSVSIHASIYELIKCASINFLISSFGKRSRLFAI